MKSTMRIIYFSWFALGTAIGHAQESLNYKIKVAAPQANYYAIAAETDSVLKTLPPDTAWESQGLFFARWKWFWGSRMGDAIDGAKTGKFSHYAGVMKSMVETPPCMNASAYPANWNLLGPIQLPRQEMGWINAVALDPNNPLVAYAGAPNGGLWRTLDIEAAQPVWQNITDQTGLPGMGIGDIRIDPSNSDIIYIATGYYTGSEIQYGMGVMKTTNGTDPLPTWEFTGLNFNPFQGEVAAVKKLIMSPVDHNTIYAYTAREVYKTTDAGATWISLGIESVITSGNREITSLIIDPINNANLVVSVTDNAPKLWRWVNNTAQWSEITSNLLQPPSRSVVLSVSNQGVFALYVSGSQKRIEVSNDGGLTWVLHEITTHYGPIFIVSGSNPNIMYIGDVTLPKERTIFKSINGGSSFIKVSEYWPETPYHGVYTHGDIRALELISASPDGLADVILAGTDGGVLYSTSAVAANGTVVNWKNANGIGLAVGQFYGLAGSEKVPGRIIGGAQDNGLATYESGSWINKVVGDAYEVVIDRETPDVAIGEKIDWGWPSVLSGGQYFKKSINGGQEWTTSIPQPQWENPSNPNNNLAGSTIPYSPAIWNVRDSPVQIDHNNNLYLGFHDLFRFNPTNNTWTALSDFTILPQFYHDPDSLPVNWGCSAFAPAPSNLDVIYFAFEGQTWDPTNTMRRKLWKTTNGGSTWSDITTGLPINWYGISGIAVDPNNADRVWVSLTDIGHYGTLAEPYNGSSRVYYSPDGGTTWTDYSVGLTPLPINVITYEQGTNDGLYVGTDVGVFYTNRNLYDADDIANVQNTGWVCFRDNLPPCIVTDLEVNYASNRLRASTYGRGIWESSLACPLNTDLHFTTSTATGLSGSFQEASNDLSATADAGNIDLVDFTGRAGNEVRLSAIGESSVHLRPGSHLFIHPCDGPGNSFQPKMVMSGSMNNLEEEEEEEEGSTELRVFPNPSTGSVTVQLREADPDQVSTLRLFDGMGKLLLTRRMTGARAELEVRQPAGLYTLVVTHGREEHTARLILKAP